MQELGHSVPKAFIGSLAAVLMREVSAGALHLGHSHLYVLPSVGLFSARSCYYFPSTYALILNKLFFFSGSKEKKKKTWCKEDISVLHGEVRKWDLAYDAVGP